MGDGDSALGLDPDWVAQAVSGELGSPESVTRLDFIGTGQMSRNVRFALDWKGGQGPESVVVKIPSPDAGTRSIGFEHRLYLKECDFYRSLADRVEVVVPQALAVHFDAEAQDFAIVLEDMVGFEAGDQFGEPTSDQVEAAIGQAAALHAPVWGRTDGPGFEVQRNDFAARGEIGESLLGLMLPAVLERLGAGLDDDVLALLDRFVEMSGRWSERVRVPTTLVHGDFRPDNFLFGVASGVAPMAVVDWQTLGLGLGVTDLAYLIGGAFEPDRRRQVESDLLECYREKLVRGGVSHAAYPVDEFLSDYAVTTLHGVVVATAATIMAERTERGDALFTLMINRHGRHALDLDALDRI